MSYQKKQETYSTCQEYNLMADGHKTQQVTTSGHHDLCEMMYMGVFKTRN